MSDETTIEQQLQPWYRNSESWVQIITGLVGIGVVVGALTKEQSDKILPMVQTVVGAVMAFLSARGYANARVAIKQARLEALYSVISQDKAGDKAERLVTAMVKAKV